MDAKNNYNDNVFINCPFDDDYKELQNAMVFAIYDCGFVPRCALEENDAGDVRFDKIRRLIELSRYGIHTSRAPSSIMSMDYPALTCHSNWVYSWAPADTVTTIRKRRIC